MNEQKRETSPVFGKRPDISDDELFLVILDRSEDQELMDKLNRLIYPYTTLHKNKRSSSR